VRAALGDAYDASTSIVHSTSWRFHREPPVLVLSYLVVLAEPPHGFQCEPVEPGQPAAPRDLGAIPVADVLTHALRHLAMLSITDPVIAATLTPQWRAGLAHYDPLPAGLLEHHFPRDGEPGEVRS
jgi:hypothetical protein